MEKDLKIETKDKKTAFFIIPGFGMKVSHKSHIWLVSYLEKLGYKVVKVPVDWKYKTLTKNTAEFVDFYNKNKSEKNYVLGFSYGAVITFLSANIVKPNKIYLCSLSPDFKEDREQMPKIIVKYIGKRRYDDAYTRSGRQYAKELVVPSVVFMGEKEAGKFPDLRKRCEETVKLARNSKLITVKDAPHQMDFPTYIEAIKNEIR